MESFFNRPVISRLHFAAMAMFHIIGPVRTIGLSLYIAVLEGPWLRRGMS